MQLQNENNAAAVSFYRIKSPAAAEFTEKKSRFIGQIFPAADADEAGELIAEAKKKYWDARHNVSAFIVGEDMPVERSTDDGEPAGTAGRPVLEVLRGANIRGAVLVVTRYFGGIKLGTGGLVRAYTRAAKMAIEEASLVPVASGVTYEVTLDYAAYGRLKSYFEEQGIVERSSDFGQDVTLGLIVPKALDESFTKALTDGSDGKVVYKQTGQGMYEFGS